jgi:hypothetical protein
MSTMPAPAPLAPEKKPASKLGKFLMVVVLLLLMLAAAFAGIGVFVLDGKYDLSREIVIRAAPQMIHLQVGDLNQWPGWLPFTKHDPSVKVTIVKPTGVGAHQHWTGKNGNGKLTFTVCDEQKGIEYQMVFDEKYTSNGAMTYSPMGNETKVTWRMTGQFDDLIGRWLAVAMPYLVGPQFEEGLADLKKKVEG